MSGSLMVNTESLSNYGEYLTSMVSVLNDKITSLDSKMALIRENWLDEGGASFKAEFSKFIQDAKKINVEIDKLGKFAGKMSSEYDTILREHCARME